MFQFRMPLIGLAIAGLLFAAGCSKKPEKKEPEAPVVQEMNIVKPDAEASETKN